MKLIASLPQWLQKLLLSEEALSFHAKTTATLAMKQSIEPRKLSFMSRKRLLLFNKYKRKIKGLTI